jgi:hypothetical protein
VGEASAGLVLLSVTAGIVYIARLWVETRDEAGKSTFWRIKSELMALMYVGTIVGVVNCFGLDWA